MNTLYRLLGSHFFSTSLVFSHSSFVFRLTIVTLVLFLGSVPSYAQENELERIEFKELPESVRKTAQTKYPDQRLLAVELRKDQNRITYLVMYEVDGKEAGLAINPHGEILDTWILNQRSVEGEMSLRPTLTNIQYGSHKRNVLDLWLAKSEEPTPLLICIHGGGFSGGDKSAFHGEHDLIQPMLDAGISVATINYRLTRGGKNAFPIPMNDGARAIQFLRYHSKKYNLNKHRLGAIGGSAGGCMLMWLGFHDDLAIKDHKDPVLRESSRLQVLAPINGQSCLHIPTLEGWFGVDSLTEHPAYRPLFGIQKTGRLPLNPSVNKMMLDASPITHLTKDDPPIYLRFGDGDEKVTNRSSANLWVHHPQMGIKLKEAMTQLGVECHVEYPGGKPVASYTSQVNFLVLKLSAKNQQ